MSNVFYTLRFFEYPLYVTLPCVTVVEVPTVVAKVVVAVLLGPVVAVIPVISTFEIFIGSLSLTVTTSLSLP